MTSPYVPQSELDRRKAIRARAARVLAANAADAAELRDWLGMLGLLEELVHPDEPFEDAPMSDVNTSWT